MKEDWLRQLMQEAPDMFSDVFVRGRSDAQRAIKQADGNSVEDFITQAKQKRILPEEAIAYYEERKRLLETTKE